MEKEPELNPTEWIEALQKMIADLKKQFPAHSIPSTMLHRLDELEDELALAIKETNPQENQ